MCGRTPKTSPSDAVVDITRTRVGSPTPVITTEPPVDPPIAENT